LSPGSPIPANHYPQSSILYPRCLYLGPLIGIRSVRFASIVGSRLALLSFFVVVVVVVVAGVVVVVVVVQPTTAAAQTTRTSGISFFIRASYQNAPISTILFPTCLDQLTSDL
jgi:hypothetical protein